MGKIMTSFKNMIGFEDEDIYDDYDVEEMEEEETMEPKENYNILHRRRETKEQNKIVNLHGNNVNAMFNFLVIFRKLNMAFTFFPHLSLK